MTDKEKIRNFVEKVFAENRRRSSIEGYAAVEQLRKVLAYIDSLNEEPASEVLEEAAIEYCGGNKGADARVRAGFIMSANWQKGHSWHEAQGDDLPEIDREVIALQGRKVVFAHRPPEYWDGKNIDTGEVTRHYPQTYDKGGWNMPGIKWWLDVPLPDGIE